MYTLQQLADKITERTGIETKLIGDGSVSIDKISTIAKAGTQQITFLANSKYKKHLAECQATAVILDESDMDAWSGAAITMKNPYAGFAIVAQLLDTTPAQEKNVHHSAVVAADVKLPESVAIGANTVIESGVEIGENVQIGAGCYLGQGTIVGAETRLWPNVTIYHDVKIGTQCVIHAGSVVGADGFGYAPQQIEGDQHWIKIPQVGGVVIGDNTEIGASTTIDRGAIDDTIIGRGVIIDNQIQLGHNVMVGDYTAIAAGTMVAGSTVIGANVTIGGACAIAGHLSIADKAFITGRTLVIKDIKEAGVYSSGMPAATNKEWRNNTARYRKLTELFDRVKQLEQTS
ncbi:MAG: UDP-3-O-(3-hydroxymyristoyl)glucosamine N-acyltransferase [Gammaproteobacteria bacterium]|nr:UDP-3-O-(3-hydroxymyristoyl)glucosamine N-acyltransferase [Gammaproteobacteria bacterium]